MKSFFRASNLIVLWVLLGSVTSNAQQISETGFIENKGQIVNQEYQQNLAVLYLFHSPNLNVQLRQAGFSYDTYTTNQSISEEQLAPNYLNETEEPIEIANYAFDRIDIDLINANANAIVEASNSVGGYLNYYTPGVKKGGVLGVKMYERVRYKNIYKGIDLEFFSENGRLKYNFILQPGAALDLIKFRVRHNGFTTINEKGSILFETSNGTIEESIPHCFYETEAGRQMVNGQFKANADGTFGIIVNQKYNGVLVIDPIPEFLKYTYYGGNGFTNFFSLSEDSQGNVLACGLTESSNNVATSGVFQNILQGNVDGMIVSFTDDLTTRNWGTYLGSQRYDRLPTIQVSNSGNIYFAGESYGSITGFGTSTSHKPVHINTNQVVIVGSMTNTGVLKWGSYYGQDTSFIGVRAIVRALDIQDDNNIIIAGTTTGTKNVAFNSPIQSSLSGSQDVFVANFDSTGSIHWGGYIGGSGSEELMSMHVTSDKSIYLTGGTTSSSTISTPGSYQPVAPPGIPGGYNNDGYLIKLNQNGLKDWGTYYDAIGDGNGIDLASDTSGNIFLFGRTEGTKGMGTIGADILEVDSGLFCSNPHFGYLAKFNSLGSRLWGTYVDPSLDFDIAFSSIHYNINKNQIEIISDIQCQRTNSIHIGGSSLTKSRQFAIWLNYNQNTGMFLRGSYIGNPNPSQNWISTADFSSYLSYSNDSVFYIAGASQQANWENVTPSSVRGFQWQKPSALRNGLILKFAYGCADLCDSLGCFAFTGDTAYCLSEDSLIEVGLDYTYVNDQMYGADTYQWTVQGPATLLHGQGDRRLLLKPDSAGIVQLAVQAFSDCDTSILATHSFQIYPAVSKPILNAKDTVFLCSGDSIVLKTTTTFNAYQWADGSSDTVYTVREGGKYYVSSGNARCQLLSDTLYVIEVTPPVKPNIQWNPVLKAFNSSMGFSYRWYRNDTLIVGAVNQSHIPFKSGQFSVEIIDINSCVSQRADQLPFYVSLNEPGHMGNITIYPNPVNSVMHVNSPNFPIEGIKIYDAQGKQVKVRDYKNLAQPKDALIDLSAFTVGYYFIEITVKHGLIGRYAFVKE